jgi:hypothetical protein
MVTPPSSGDSPKNPGKVLGPPRDLTVQGNMSSSPIGDKSLRRWWTTNVVVTVISILITLLLVPPLIVMNVRSAWRRTRLQREIRRMWPAAVRFLVRDDEDEWSALLRKEWLPNYAEVTILVPPTAGGVGVSAEERLARRVLDEWGGYYKWLGTPLAVVVVPGRWPQAMHGTRNRRLEAPTYSGQLRQRMDVLLAFARTTVHSTD